MINTKVIVNYLPQFYRTPQNDKWWGYGYTDWVAVQNAKSLYKGHQQPNEPMDGEYYDLSNVKNIRKQAILAKQAGIFGFAIYHYWFNDKQNFLTTPSELLLNDKSIDINFLFIWDNGSWKRSWSAVKSVKYADDWAPKYSENMLNNVNGKLDNNGILALLSYGTEKEWTNHFNYLLPFFKDDRYIKIDNKPLFGIFHSDNEPETLIKMLECWNKLAVMNGFNGISTFSNINNCKIRVTDYQYYYEPYAHTQHVYNPYLRFKYKAQREFKKIFPGIQFINYDNTWKAILKSANKTNENVFPGAIVSYDDTPRRGKAGRVLYGASPIKFGYYMEKLISISKQNNKRYIFVTAWNEWAEGAYLEPDRRNKYMYLNELKKAIGKTNND